MNLSITAAMLFLAVSAGLVAEEIPWNHLRPEHPRLLSTKPEFEALRKRSENEPVAKRWRQAIVHNGNNVLRAAPSRYEIPDGKRLLAVSRRVLERVSTCGLLWQIEGDRKWPERAWVELSAAAQFPNWNPKHFLDTAEMTAAFAIGYDWMFDAWSGEQRQLLRNAILTKGLAEGTKAYARPERGWPAATHNWNQVCNGGMTLGALALADEAPEQTRPILAAALASIPRAMKEYSPDGGYREGVAYWSYGTGFNILMIAALQSALGTDLGLTKAPGFEATAWFPIHGVGPSGRIFNFADSHEGGVGRNWAMGWLGRQFKNPAFTAFSVREERPDAIQFLWLPETPSGTPPPLPLGAVFRDVEMVSLRSSWSDPQATWAALKAGSPHFNHAQMDVGTFVFEMSGQRWAVDLGSDDYNLPGYFDTRTGRWKFYRNRAEGHNTLVVAPGAGLDQELNPISRILRSSFAREKLFAIADLAPSYGQRVKKARRGLRIFPDGALLVQDEIECEAGPVWWFLHTKAEATPSRDGKSLMLSQGGKSITATLLSPKEASFQILPAEPFPASPKVPGQAANKGIQKLALHVPTPPVRFDIAVQFSPAASAPAAAVQPLEKW